MGFQPPTFVVPVNIWHSPNVPPAAPDITVTCNLAWGKRIAAITGLEQLSGNLIMTLLLPMLTDIRSSIQGTNSDIVEAPAGSGRFYVVFDVDDIGKGFANEHRAATLQQTSVFGAWPTPMP